MKEVIFKVKDNRLNIIVDEDLSNEEFLELLKNRLQRLIVLRDTATKDVVLNLSNRTLNNREILQLFDILNDANIFYLGKVICKNNNKDRLVIYKGNFRGGQSRFFENSALIVGCINPGSRVIVSGDLYVLGRINGDIELKNHDSKLYCENICNSLVKIGDVYKLYDLELNDKEIYLNGDKIEERDYKKGEKLSGKSNSCYIR